ncbi:hypothetical protein HETIRDRAFT_118847 [Heterobasidion irregulare TC 32-1]|uniref:Uncharacterized protein n=1 Tax=Heterobasidion irregulare (strain TC 32-1) TaxID=747525 RepID=W4JU24_HETIT|nr:uncharacterized protein HETIRDRAFT_118847 [Heterobasidion irregulare TC 32-1]ETW76595.1 hypothetical protein HETIRDRAFT_118847 [Heterobasidion irregulare TC 32-1]
MVRIHWAGTHRHDETRDLALERSPCMVGNEVGYYDIRTQELSHHNSTEPSRPTKKRKVEVVVPERSVGEIIMWTKAVRARKPVQCLPTSTHTILAPSHPHSFVVPALSDSSRLSSVVAQGIASELWYHIAVAEGMRASLARSIAMWQGELASIEARSGGLVVSDVVLVEDSLDAEDSDMSVLGDFVPDVWNSFKVSVIQ